MNMSWKDIIKEDKIDKTVKRLGFYDVLKMLSPRQFLEGMQGIVGGEITGGYSKTSRGRQSLSMTLTFDGGVLRVRGAGGKFFVNLNGIAIGEDYNLTELRPITEEKLGEFRIKKSIKTATRSAELWAMNDEEYYFKIRAHIKSLVKSGHDKEETIQELAVWLPDMMRHIEGFMEELETEDWDGSIDAISDVDWEVVARNYEDDVDGILEDFA